MTVRDGLRVVSIIIVWTKRKVKHYSILSNMRKQKINNLFKIACAKEGDGEVGKTNNYKILKKTCQ